MICRQCGTLNENEREDCVRCHKNLHPDDMKGKIACSVHANREATTSCAGCATRLCAACAVNAGGVDFCEACAPESALRHDYDEDYERIPVIDPARAQPAGFGRRLLALVIDSAFVLVVVFILSLIIFLFTNKLLLLSLRSGGAVFVIFWLVVLVLVVVYSSVMTSMNGQTWGKQVAGVIVLQPDGHILSLKQTAIRSSAAILSAAVFGLGFLWAIWDPNQETWHDKIAGNVGVPLGRGFVAGMSAELDKTITAELDSDVLQRGWAAVEARSPICEARVDWAARTDIGRVREHNEDKFDFFLPEDPTILSLRGRLWAVADGMGGHSAGQIASEAALKTLIRSYFSPMAPADPEQALRDALTEANALIYQAARRVEGKAGMGTTIVAAVLRDDQLTIAHIGDSRAYLLRADEPLQPLTSDHSWVEEMVQRGAMSRDEAEASPNRHYILRSVGVMATVEPDIKTLPVETGDLVLLCSDGLTGPVADDALAAILSRGTGLGQIALDLIDAANDGGGRDNSTALLLHVGTITTAPAAETATP